jgi:plastocyanin
MGVFQQPGRSQIKNRRCLMGRIFKTDRSPDIRINRLFKYSLLFSLTIGFFIPVSAFWGNAAPSDHPSLNPGFSISTMDKGNDFPVHWVAAGGDVLAYGAGQHVDFALESDPFTTVSHLTFDGIISEALILGKYALLGQEGLGLRMIDLSMPSNPLDLGFYPLSGTAFRLVSRGNLLFVAGVDPGIHVFELSFSYGQNPQISLIDRGSISVPDPITALAATELNLYVALAGKGIRIYDVSDPSLILEVESLPVTLPVRSMAINGDSLFVAAGAEGLHVIDLSVPGNAGSLATHPVQSESLYLAGRLLYLATGNDGLHLLKAGPIGAATFNVQVAPGGQFVFSPQIVNVNTGDSINWTWGGSNHSTTSGANLTFDGIWDSGVHSVPFSFPFTFNTPGSFPYFCSVHGFTGTVIVASTGPVINISVNPTTINFGNINVGQSSDQTITITNQATSNATLTGSVGTLSAPFSVQSGGGAFSLTPAQSVTVTVRFSPTAEGAAATNLSIIHNATNQGSPSIVALNGTGVSVGPAINISVTPAAVNFGNVNVGQFSDQTITIANQASSTAPLTGNVDTLAAPFSVQTGGGAFSLTPGQSMPVTVRFSPTAAGAASDNLSITHNATNQTSPTNIPLSGTGITPGAGVVVSFISGPTIGKPGGRIPIQNTVTNQETQTAATVTVNFYLSTDTQIDTGDTFIGKRTVKNLAPGASSGPVSTMVTIPRNIAQGSYFIGAIAGTNTNFDPNGIAICPSFSKPKLLSPKNRGTNISTTPTLTWSNVTGASTYEVQAATDSGFTNIVASMTGLTTPQWAVSPTLNSGTSYFWRSRGVNLCGPGPFSATWSFKTAP